MEYNNLDVFIKIYLMCCRIWLHLLLWHKGYTSNYPTATFTYWTLMKSLSHSLIPT